MTQHGLSDATGIKQSTIAEMEVSGQSSLWTPQIARACGVDAYWLATGEGPMLGRQAESATIAQTGLAEALEVLSDALQDVDKSIRIAVAPLLAAMASDPADAKKQSDLILKLLVTDADKADFSSHDELRSSHIYRRTPRLTLGDENGRSDTDAAAGAGKK